MAEKSRKYYDYNKCCPVLGCTSSTKKSKKIKFFSFPKKNRGTQSGHLAKVWSVFTRRKNFKPNSVEVMCEIHFQPDLIKLGKKRKDHWLKTGAVPTIYYDGNKKIVVPYDPDSEQYYGPEAQQLFVDTENFVVDHEEDIARERLQKIKKLKNLCRFCFAYDNETAKTVAITKLEHFSINIQEMQQLIGVNSNADELFSDIVCEKCFTQIIDIDNYRRRCQKAQQEYILELEELDKKLKNVRMQKAVSKPMKSEVWFKVKVEPEIIVEEEFNELPEEFHDDVDVDVPMEVEEMVKTELKVETERIEEMADVDQNWEDEFEIVNEEDDEGNDEEAEKYFEEAIKPTRPKKDYEKIVEQQRKYNTEYSLRTFECFWCHDKLKGYASYQVHLKKCKHEVQCDEVGCRKTFTNQGAYNYHLIQRHKREKVTRYFCNICNVNHQTTKTKFEQHCVKCIEENKFKEQSIECGICKKTFNTLQLFSAHKLFHGPSDSNLALMVQPKRGLRKGGSIAKKDKQLMCDICGKIFKDHAKLKRHRDDVHYVEFDGNMFQCDLCPVAKFTKRLLYTHMKSSHIIKEHPCEICGKVFKNRELWRKHQLIHNGAKRNNLCHLCPHQPGFVTTSALKKHHWKHHGGLQPARPHICDECGAAYSLPHLLVRHKIKLHNL